jgi:hypothetical protein
MENERPEAEKNAGVFLSPTDMGGGGFVVPMKPLNVGPGEPGPGDEWHMPDEPAETSPAPQPAAAAVAPPTSDRKR